MLDKGFLQAVLIIVLNLFLRGVTGNIIGKERIFVKEGQTASFEWTFNFDINQLQLMVTSWNGKVIAGMNGQRQTRPTDEIHFQNRLLLTTNTANNRFVFRLDVNDIKVTDEGVFQCRVTMIDFLESKNSTLLIVVVRPVIDTTQKLILEREDQIATLNCTVLAGNPRPLTFQWFKVIDSKNVVKKGPEQQLQYYAYEINPVSRDSRGYYLCRVSNGHGGFDEHRTELKVYYKPHITTIPENCTVFEKVGSETMDCEADGGTLSGPTKYHWYKGTREEASRIKNDDQLNGVTIKLDGKRLHFEKPDRTMSMFYFCAGENKEGTGAARKAFLNVTYVPGQMIVMGAVEGVINGNEGTNMTVVCESDANPPALYTWKKYQRDSKGILREIEFARDSPSGNLYLYNVNSSDTAEYKCVAKNFPDDVKPSKAYHNELKVKVNIRYGPKETNFTANQLYNQNHVEIKVGERVELLCESHSNPPALYNIQKVPNKQQLNLSGLFVINQIRVEEEGDYKCIASNAILGLIQERQVTIVVAIPPKVDQSLMDEQTVREGATIDINCKAEGKPPPFVYWQRYGANITSDNIRKIFYNDNSARNGPLVTIHAQLKFNGIRYTDDASYSCIIHNSAGQQNWTSRMIVEYTPKITTKPLNYTTREKGETINLICGAIANPVPVSWQWYFNDKLQSLATTHVFSRGVPSRDDNGTYRCEAVNSLGTGESATAHIIVEYAPQIISKSKDYIANVSDNVLMRCEVKGIPTPKITWTRLTDGGYDEEGVELIINDVKPSDKDTYSCTAMNVVGSVSASIKLLVNHAPIIMTVLPADTKIGVEIGDRGALICKANSFPPAKMFWKQKGATTALADGQNGYTIKSPVGTEFFTETELSLNVNDKTLGMQFFCNAENKYGSSEQDFQILGRGKPEAPIKLEVSDVIQPTVPVTVNITLTWVPGFSGGHPVEYYLLYREATNNGDFNSLYLGFVEGNTYEFTNRKTSTEYVFSLKAKNILGSSAQMQPFKEFTTKDPPPAVATVRMERDGEDGTSIIIFWVIHPNRVRRDSVVQNIWKYGLIRYRIVDKDVTWSEEKILNIAMNGSYLITGLIGDQLYQLQFFLFKENGEFGLPVDIGTMYPSAVVTKGDDGGLSKTDIIAIAVGCGGAILLVLVIVLFICIYRKKGNKYGKQYNGRVQVDIPVSTISKNNYGTGDMIRSSYVPEEDDFYALDSSVIDDEKSPPPGYNETHFHNRQYPDPTYQFRTDAVEVTPSYTSFGRLPKTSSGRNQGKIDKTDNPGSRATEITRSNRNSTDRLDDHPQQHEIDPLLRRSINDIDDSYHPATDRRVQAPRVSSDYDLPDPPTRLHSDDNNLDNRVPGAFGDRFKKTSPPKYGDPPSQPPGNSGRASPPSSVASSKPYRSDNEYIDETEDNYVGYLV